MISRRTVLKGAAAAALLPAGCATSRSSLIVDENAKPGTTDWIPPNPRAEAQARCPWIEGFCSRTSVRAGETLEIKVSANPASPFVLDLYRMGCYSGKGGGVLGRAG